MSCNFSEIYKKLQSTNSETSKNEPSKSTSELSDVSFSSLKNDVFKHFLMKECRIINTSDVIFTFVDGKFQREPIEYINQARFSKEIHENLFRKGYRSVFPIQAHAWNALCEGQAATIVSSKCSGKTLTYLPALLSHLVDIDLEEENSVGPFGLIFASSAQEVDIIYELCRQLVNLNKVSIVIAAGKWNLHEKQLKLLNGCHLLITTPPCFLRLVTQIDDLTVFDRDKLKHLVFDNFDEIYEKYKESFLAALKICTYPAAKSNMNPQIITTTTKWQESTANLQALSCFPLTIIDDHIEAAIYAKSRFIISRTTMIKKQKQLIQQLKSGEYRKQNTIVFVSNLSELEIVKKICASNMIEFVTLSAMATTSVDDVWKKKVDGGMKVVLATDDAMIRYKVKNAQILIHFSLPKTWTVFTKRFAMCFNYYKSYVESKSEKPIPTSIVMMDEENVLEVPKMISFLRDHRLVKSPHQVPEEVLKFVYDIGEAIERQKLDPSRKVPVQICSRTLKFGKCSSYKCAKRHAFLNEVDTPKFLPTQGQIKFSLLAVKTPIEYVIKIKENREREQDEWISWKYRNDEIEQKLSSFQEFMSDEKNVMIQPIAVGDMYAYFSYKDVKWYRARVLDIETSEDKLINRATVHLIDKGESLLVRTTHLMKLESQYKFMPPLVFELRILNLLPFDSDVYFDKSTLRQMDCIFNQRKNHGDVILAQIAITVQDTIYSTNFHVLKHLANSKTFIVKLNLKQVVLSNELAIKNDEIYEQLRQLAIRAGLKVAEKEQEGRKENVLTNPKPQKIKKEVPTTSFALLKSNNTYSVHLFTFRSPDSFYVMLCEHFDNLDEILANFIPEVPLKDIKKYNYCIYKQRKDEYEYETFRAMIQNDQELELFLLDVGILKRCSRQDLFEIPNDILKIPFTSVQCKLSGVKSKKKKWDERSVASFKHLLKNISKNGCYDMTVSHQISEGYYQVSLISSESKKDLARAAIKANYAEADIAQEETIKVTSSKIESLLENDDALTGNMNELLKMIGLPETTKILPPKNIKVEAPEKLQLSKSVPKIKTKHNLSRIYEHPYIDWYQEDAVISLKIDFQNALDYALDVTESTLTVFLIYFNSKKYARIELYGSIQPKLSSHSLNNENEITVRLAKRVCNVKWPRLTSEKEKNYFITFREGDMLNKDITLSHKIHYLPADYDDISDDEDFNSYEDHLQGGAII